MKTITDIRIQNANNVNKDTLVETIKAADPTRFDQMLIESEERKTYFFLKYKALAYTRVPKTLKFPLFKDLQNDFEKTVENSGEIKILNDDRVIQKVISKGYSPIETKKYTEKKLVFSELKLVTENDKVKLKQPFYYLPSETERHTCGTCNGHKYTTCTEPECHGQHIYDCNRCSATGKIDCNNCGRTGQLKCKKCNARGEYSCGSCGGRGEKKCLSCQGSGTDHNGKRCTSCSGRGFERCAKCRDGIIRCEKCSGKGEVRCESCSGHGEVTCSKCDGRRQITCRVCYGDHTDGRYGKVDCITCETAGELASISYVETTVKTDDLDLIFTDKTEIMAPGFGIETIKQFTDANGHIAQTYKSLNGDNHENYDEYSTACSNYALGHVGDFKDRYPKLVSEEMYYEGVPCATFNYNHILSATFHDVSVLNIDKAPFVLFHSNPADVAEERESFKDKVNEWFRQAFSTKAFKDKLDRKHEMFLMVHMAKADGVIEEREKRYLSKTITGLHGFTRKEKAEIFNLMSTSVLPPISPTNAYFSTRERADEAKKKIVELVAKADGEYEPQERAKFEEINRAIELGYKAKPSALGRFFKTWQISVSMFLILCLFAFGAYYGLVFYPDYQAERAIKEQAELERFQAEQDSLLRLEQQSSEEEINSAEQSVKDDESVVIPAENDSLADSALSIEEIMDEVIDSEESTW